MKRLFTIIAICMLSIFAKSANTIDKWFELIQYAGLSQDEVKTACPHFPNFADYNSNTMIDFTEKRELWMKKHSEEITAFLALAKIKKLNPSMVDLGLKKEGEELSPTFENGFWNWYLASKVSPETLKSFAPHFPFPNNTSDIAKDEKIYGLAVEDWTKLFIREYEAFINYPALKALSNDPSYMMKLEGPEGTEAFKLLRLASDVKPVFENYDSGNPALDKVRFDLYTMKWYAQYATEDYYKIYIPTEYDNYLKIHNTDISKK